MPKDLKSLDLTSSLREVREPVIQMECQICGRNGSFIRADIVKKHGASVTFAKLRRMAAMGCERLMHPDGDSCGTQFSCLDKTKA